MPNKNDPLIFIARHTAHQRLPSIIIILWRIRIKYRDSEPFLSYFCIFLIDLWFSYRRDKLMCGMSFAKNDIKIGNFTDATI